MSKTDIQSRDDIKKLLVAFYEKATTNDQIGSKFDGLDMSKHIEVITDFWEMILLGGVNYKGDPFGKHIKLALKPAHFDTWVSLFHETVDELFVGDVANEAKTRGSTISKVFQHKLRFS